MSMMDAMSMGAQPQPQTQPMSDSALRMGGDDPSEMEGLYKKVMMLISGEIWEGQGADLVSEQLVQDSSDPAEIIGKFTGYYLTMAVTAAKSKGGAFPPVVIVGAAGETSSQLTDLALMLKVIDADNADDTADAGALIGLEVLLSQGAQVMSPEDKQEFADITKAIINASPNAEAMAEDGAEDAIEDFEELGASVGTREGDEAQEDIDDDIKPQGMAAAMGGM